MINLTLAQQSKALQNKHFSSVELAQAYLNRIEKLNAQLNSFITVTPEIALQAARKADESRAQGNTNPLLGIPIAHKDIFCTEGVKTSCGSKMLDNFIAPYTATIVQKLADAGCVMLGKTNMDEFAMGSSNENSYYGPVRNPRDLNKVPGGSSGGSAAAVAARLAPAATGTDTGGSIRQPAAWCGITGLKPTYGLLSRYGMIAYASSLDHGGPMAQTAEDLALLLQAMAGSDPRDSTSVEVAIPNYSETLNNSLSGKRIGIPRAFYNKDLAPEIATLLQATIRQFESLGATLVDVELPSTHLALPTYYMIAPAECSSNLARYDGVRFGHRAENPVDLNDLYSRTRAEGFGNEVKRRILIGTYALSSGFYDAYYKKAQQVRRIIRDELSNVFTKVDMLLTPATPTTAFDLGAKSRDPVSMYLTDIYTIPANLAGIPAISFPIGFANNMPVGAQLLGPAFAEAAILNAVHCYQQATCHHNKTPTEFQVS